MLWFRTAAVTCLVLSFLLALGILLVVVVMVAGPSGDRAMDSDPFYNGTLFFYVLVIVAEAAMTGASGFGFSVAFKVWRNNHQLDHKLRHLFTVWLGVFTFATFALFILGLMGLIRHREPQEEITALYEIFAKYSQDVKFVGSFERIQREHSCCGINGPEDWYSAQFKTGGSSSMSSMGMDMSFMGIGSPSTGKCHLTPPTIPMGCGKKIRELVYFTMSIYAGLNVLQTACAICTAGFSWYCFFYWIEKEVIIIPEDEVSNLIVLEPESSTSTVYSRSGSGSQRSSASGSTRSGSVYTQPSGSGRLGRESTRRYLESRFSRVTGQSTRITVGRGSRPTYYDGYTGSRRYYPNSRRGPTTSYLPGATNYAMTSPTIGGPLTAYHYPPQNEAAESVNHNFIVDEPSYRQQRDPNAAYFVPRSRNAFAGQRPASGGAPTSSRIAERRLGQSRMTRSGDTYYEGDVNPEESFGASRASVVESYHKRREERVKKPHSFNHMLHKQEKALGGKIIAEMHIDHNRDPEAMNSEMDTAKGKRGHRAHHATIVIVRKKNQKKSKTLLGHPPKGHGQTGHLAEDIIDMSGGAAAVKSLVDDLTLPVEHNPEIGGEGYVNKLHRLKKNKSQLDHPDPDHGGHGAVHQKGGKVSAPSIDGSQAQSLMDNLLHPHTKPKKVSVETIKPHEVKDIDKKDKDKQSDKKGHHNKKHPHHAPHKAGHSRQRTNYANQSAIDDNYTEGGGGAHHKPKSYYQEDGSLRTDVIFKNPNRSSIIS